METSYPPSRERFFKTLKFLREREDLGATWFELGEEFGWHHGQSSAVLSTLHKEDRISRLKEKRGKSYIYVDHFHVGGRPTGQYGRMTVDQYEAGYREGYASGHQDGIGMSKAMAHTVLSHVNDPLTVHSPRCWMSHPACAVRAVIAQINAQGRREAA